MSDTSFDRRTEEESEAVRHDRLYSELAAKGSLVMNPSDWQRFDGEPQPWKPYESLVRMLGDVRGKRILDAGCGDGWLSVILAKRGATLDGFDISPSAVRFAQERATIHDVADRCTFRAASAYKLPYGDAEFDGVIGSAILHHLGDKAVFAKELRRVMKPGAVAVFQEPFGNSLVLERVRTYVPVPSMSPDDPDQWKQQFKYSDVEAFRKDFDVDVQEYHLMSRLDRVIPAGRIMTFLEKLDRIVLRALPFVRRYARTVLLRLRPRPNSR
jgi:2-polyprenyl-3-methyl-5-hydroxy-6-metoxy-1,4-benzoquinol methylase